MAKAIKKSIILADEVIMSKIPKRLYVRNE